MSEFYVLFVRKFGVFLTPSPPLCADVIYGSPLISDCRLTEEFAQTHRGPARFIARQFENDIVSRVRRFYEFFKEVYQEHERTFDPAHTRQGRHFLI